MYSVSTKVEFARREGLPLLTLRVAGQWQRVQRRDAVRVPVAIRPRVVERLVGDQRQKLRAGIANLSGTGLQVRSQDELKPGDVLELAFTVMDIDEDIETQAIVRRVQQYDRGSLRIWDAGCEFQDLPKHLAQKLVQFIFAQQRALARARKAI